MQMRCAVTVALLLCATAALAHPPVSVVLDSKGNIYYSDLNQVWRMAPDGKRTVAVPGVHTHELFMDEDDYLYGEHLWYEGDATKKWGHYVWRRDPNGQVSKVRPDREGFLQNYSFVRDRAGHMYWASEDRKSVIRNGAVYARGFRDIRWMAATPKGYLYFIDAGDLVRIVPGEGTKRVARGLAKTTLLRPHVADRHALMGIWFDGAGNVYVANPAQGQVMRVTPAGVVSVFQRSILPWSPSGGAFAPNGDLLLLEYSATNDVRVRRVPMERRRPGG